MKQYFIDLCLVIILVCVINIFFGHYNVSQTLFDRSIDQFEETVTTHQEINQSYITIQDTSDNQVSTFFETISQYCVKIIEFIVLVFSNFVSMFIYHVVY